MRLSSPFHSKLHSDGAVRLRPGHTSRPITHLGPPQDPAGPAAAPSLELDWLVERVMAQFTSRMHNTSNLELDGLEQQRTLSGPTLRLWWRQTEQNWTDGDL
ncbi:unnamed protein product [Pleuronectes platessa]|uniref:Uncharacterized protein n=1 Tax=Pleuronectes platessa TaxID=8262 RepID=A0A9N7UTF0_PLEPL|nr:unnamed protein product [Pleuronectes platessa]